MRTFLLSRNSATPAKARLGWPQLEGGLAHCHVCPRPMLPRAANLTSGLSSKMHHRRPQLFPAEASRGEAENGIDSEKKRSPCQNNQGFAFLAYPAELRSWRDDVHDQSG